MWWTLEGSLLSRSAIPLALFVRPSPWKGGPTVWWTFEGSLLSRSAIPLALFVRPSPLKGGPTGCLIDAPTAEIVYRYAAA